ncbi:unnamed protein product, partial [Linum tenue]
VVSLKREQKYHCKDRRKYSDAIVCLFSSTQNIIMISTLKVHHACSYFGYKVHIRFDAMCTQNECFLLCVAFLFNWSSHLVRVWYLQWILVNRITPNISM